MEKEKNYNHLFLSGHIHIDDERYCEMMELDPSLAGTREINNTYLANNPTRKLAIEKKLELRGN